jgi:hypothetical protein
MVDDVVNSAFGDQESCGITRYDFGQNPSGRRHLFLPALSAIKPSRICCLTFSSYAVEIPSLRRF